MMPTEGKLGHVSSFLKPHIIAYSRLLSIIINMRHSLIAGSPAKSDVCDQICGKGGQNFLWRAADGVGTGMRTGMGGSASVAVGCGLAVRRITISSAGIGVLRLEICWCGYWCIAGADPVQPSERVDDPRMCEL